MATHITTYTPAGMASARKGAPENCSCTSGSGSVFSGDGPTGRVRQRLRSTARGRGVRETESTAEHGRMQRSPCPLERGLEYKNTRFPSRSPAKHRAEDNAGDSDEQRQPLEIGEVLPHLGDAVDAIRDPSEARDKGGEYNGGAVDRRDDRHRHKHECECRNAQLAASVHYESYPPALAPRVLAAGPQREALLNISRVLHDEQRKRGDQSRQSSETHAKTLPRCCGELNPVVRLTVIQSRIASTNRRWRRWCQ
mmetsp:Transcript_15862/g.47501  ORF Transcript_15862/g.47501 Transcript_15862/m.47501 type:complete len:253 (-) Transcript_15862:125-883(-)